MMNKYTYWRTLTALMLVMVGVCACTDELDGLGVDSTRPSDVICFTASLSDTRSASQTRSASGHLEIEQEDWLVGTEQSITRGTPVTLLEGSAGVIGYVYNTWSTSVTPLTNFHNKQFNFDGDELTAASNNVRWATLDQSNVRFYAYAPYDQTGETLSSKEQGGSPQMTYIVNETPANQHDLIVASWEGPTSYKHSIPLVFNHALTAVRFKVGFDCYVTGLTIEGVYNSGTYTFDSGWSVGTSTKKSYTFTINKQLTADSLITDGDNTLMMIPQTLPSGAKVALTYKTNENDATEKTIISTIANKVWQQGKMITYSIHEGRAPQYVYFDLAAGNVTINATEFSGKVYTSSSATTATTVEGKHESGNRYYVYQSTPTKRGEGKGVTTISTVNGEETYTHTPLDYPLVTLEDGRLWSDYITNNTEVQEVIKAWDNAEGAGQATQSDIMSSLVNGKGAAGAVRRAGRMATKNRIHITGKVGDVYLYIDNIYSSYQQRGSTPMRTRTNGGISFIPSWTDGNSTLTINIIGDNRLGCVNYQNINPNINSLVFEGTGSLTVADADYYRDNTGLGSNRSCSVIGGKDEEETEEDVYNITFNSGVIYAGGTTSNCTAIGGGGNGNTSITINGGTITAVTNSTGAAIGGGTGLVQPGGIGNVTINGGNIYAYNFRDKTKDVIPAAAIGGGGSSTEQGNAGNVTINGGYVYAYSGYGTAIGGGSSRDKQGGNAVVNIFGGQVIAKSKDGTGIGGGTGSATNYNANGGNASVTIDGNPIIRTGSIGGGGKGPQSTGTIGSATIKIEKGCEADIQAQFVMAAGIASGASNSFTMNGGTIRNSCVDDDEYKHIQTKGGAVYLEDGTFTMTGGTIKNCSAEQGGAVYVESTSGSSSFTMSGGSIIDCNATGNSDGSVLGHGGAVCLSGGTVTMSGGTIKNNYSVSGNGGGVYISNGNFTMHDGLPQIIGNAAHKGNGGGVYVTSTSDNNNNVTVSLLKGEITNNAANNNGGGVCVDMGNTNKSAMVTVGDEFDGNVTEVNANPKITTNMAALAGGGLYVNGQNANVTINSGMIDKNKVSAYVFNQDVFNKNGTVMLNNGLVTHVVVKFVGNGGILPVTHKETYTQNIVTNTNSKLIRNNFSNPGYKFKCWNNRKDGLGNITYSDEAFANESKELTLYAIWVLDQ